MGRWFLERFAPDAAAGAFNDWQLVATTTLSMPALGFSAYMAWASWFVLKVLCLLCLATYVAVTGLFLVSGLSSRFSMSMLPARLSRDLRALPSSRPRRTRRSRIPLATDSGLPAPPLFVS